MIVKTLNEYCKTRVFKTDTDIYNIYEETFIEIPPFTKDDKGDWLNDSSVSKWVKGDKFNVDEFIQSHRDSVDLAKIIDLVTKTGDTSLLNRRQGFYADISGIPQNQNDFHQKIDDFINTLSGIDKDIAIKIMNGDVSNDEIYKMFEEKYFSNTSQNNENIKQNNENIKENNENGEK